MYFEAEAINRAQYSDYCTGWPTGELDVQIARSWPILQQVTTQKSVVPIYFAAPPNGIWDHK